MGDQDGNDGEDPGKIGTGPVVKRHGYEEGEKYDEYPDDDPDHERGGDDYEGEGDGEESSPA